MLSAQGPQEPCLLPSLWAWDGGVESAVLQLLPDDLRPLRDACGECWPGGVGMRGPLEESEFGKFTPGEVFWNFYSLRSPLSVSSGSPVLTRVVTAARPFLLISGSS